MRLPLPARKAVAWVLDYLYVGYWQLAGFLFRRDPAHYLDTSWVSAGAAGGRVGPEQASEQAPGPAPVPTSGPEPLPGPAPVVLIPGIYETWQFMRPVADRVHRLGRPVHVVKTLGYNHGKIADMAVLVGAYLEEQGLREVVLVAHSKGGLIGKYLMTLPGPGARVATMIAVNTPFSGSVYADLFLHPAIRAFSPRDLFLRQLAANEEVNGRITSVYSSFDPHIPGGSHLPGARNIMLETMGHFRPLSDPRLLAAVEEALLPQAH